MLKRACRRERHAWARKGMGEKGMGEKGMGMGQTPGELAKTQQQIQDATKAFQHSQQANNAAQAALQQAQANSPHPCSRS